MEAIFLDWPHDDTGEWREGSVGFGQVMLWNTPESRYEILPRCEGDQGARVILVADLRLDNRNELARELRLGAQVASLTDSELLLAAYRRWGQSCPLHLLGDFAFVIWDEPTETLFCARDQIGVRPFYYSLDDANFVFASHVHAVAASGLADKSLCETALLTYLKEGELYSPDLTFYAGIKKLPPGSTLTLDESGVVLRSYWDIEDSPSVALDDSEAYRFELERLLEQSIACRLRTEFPAAAHLSGGLDSSVITAFAAKTLRERGQKLKTYNWCPASRPEESDLSPEVFLSNLMADVFELDHQFVSLTADDLHEVIENRDISNGDTADLWYEDLVLRDAAAAGCRSILSGWGGDQLISNYGNYALLDIFLRNPLMAARFILTWSKGKPNKPRHIASLVYRAILKPLGAYLTRNLCVRLKHSQENFATYAQEAIANRVKSVPAILWDIPVLTVRDDQLSQFRNGHLQNRLESWAAASYAFGVRYSFPLLDRRVVEFAVSLPPDCYWRGGNRYLMRRVFRDIMPQQVLDSPLLSESGRVEQLALVEREALIKWRREQPNFASRENTQSDLIDVAALKAELVGLESQDARVQADYRDAVDTMLKSIFVLNAESRFW